MKNEDISSDHRSFEKIVKEYIAARNQLNLTDEFLYQFVVKILDSEQFMTALRSTLPLFEDDESLGFNHIPYILHSIDQRRKRFEKSTAMFLRITLILGVLAAITLSYFGYILVEEEAVGLPKKIASIERSLTSLSDQFQDIGFISIPLTNNKEFKKAVFPDLKKLSEQKWATDDNYNIYVNHEIDSLVKIMIKTGNIQSLFQNLQNKNLNFNSNYPTADRNAQISLNNAIRSLNTFMRTRDGVIASTYYAVTTIDDAKPELQKTISEYDRFAEILKRVILGIVIVSFFLAILRYFATLYNDHLGQLTRAEKDDLAVRKFYIAYKCSNDQERQIVISQFMRLIETTDNKDKFANFEHNLEGKEQGELLKEILKVLSKRI